MRYRFAKAETEAFENWIDDTINPKESQPDADAERADAARGMWASSKEIQSKYKTWQDFMNSEEFDDYLQDDTNKFEGTFEDIKPFIEQHLKEGGDKTTAIKTAIENFNADKLSESRTKIVEAIKSKVTKEDTGFNIAGVEGEVERITELANYQI